MLKIEPRIFIILVWDKASVATKNGKSEGTTEVAHNVSPDFTAGKLVFENISKQKVKHKNINGMMFLFTLIT